MSGIVVMILLKILRWIQSMHTRPFLMRDKDQDLSRLNLDHNISMRLVRMSSDNMNKEMSRKVPSKTSKIS